MLKSRSSFLLGAAFAAGLISQSVHAEVVNFRSGNGTVGSTDNAVRFAVKSNDSITDTDFASASNGAFATVVNSKDSQWISALTEDPAAQWVATSPSRALTTALYAFRFDVKADKVHSAKLHIAYAIDDALGSPTVPGLYLNGKPLANSNAPNGQQTYAAEYVYDNADIGASLKSGENTLYVFQRDVYCTYSGVLLSATVTIEPAVDILFHPRAPSTPNYDRKRYVSVAILGSPNFDVSKVDRTSVRLGPSQAKGLLWLPSPHGLIGDYNGDGIKDLAMLFSVAQTGLNQTSGIATLTGKTVDGETFTGRAEYKVQ